MHAFRSWLPTWPTESSYTRVSPVSTLLPGSEYRNSGTLACNSTLKLILFPARFQAGGSVDRFQPIPGFARDHLPTRPN
jgi:hypothetical protein